MTYFKNKYQMQKASDDEIREFFASTIFEGIFSTEVKNNNHVDYYKGHIHSIKVNGEPTNVIGSYINVPTFANDIPEGECTFKCRVKDVVRTSPSQINFTLSPKTLRSKGTPMPMSHIETREGELSKEDLFELWGVDDCECIGFYHFDSKSGGYLIDDLRKTNFDRIPPYLTNKRPITLWLKYPQKDIELDNYYRFTWKLSNKDPKNPYEIYLDNRYSPQAITPKWFIDRLFEDRHSDKSKNFGSAANFLDTLSKQLSARESTFVYELLQNANDYPVEGQMVDVEFHITDNYLLFLHSGDKFNVRNISGICGINEKEKISNRKTIGYKGIGFKTVFLNNHYVYLRTGDYSFRFDQGETPEKKRGGKIKRQDAPFQILPIWTGHNEVSPEVNSVFDKAAPKFQVQIALRPDSQRILHFGRNSYENLFREVFSDSNIILFIPNINSVRVFINGKEERACYRNNDEWIVGDYESEIDPILQKRINKTIKKGKSRIPEKYTDFDYTRVSFACKHKGAMISQIDDATLYCYLPTGASWGLPFLMNTDMIPKGDRNDIETEVELLELEDSDLEEDDNIRLEDINEKNGETNFNEELAYVAGSKLFVWIRDLLMSKKYQLGSVFSMVPDFKKSKREHKDYSNFIEKFEGAFNTCLETETIVPVPQGIALVNKVILDTTGLSMSGIMTDDEFRKFTGMEDYYLPLPMLRKDKHFNSFLKRYAEEEQIFDKDCLTDLISNDDFKEWLKDQDNNNKFLNFLLENDYLEDYINAEIFIEEECGKLFSSSDLYYNIDEELKDLSAFSSHLCYLSFKTREFFQENEKWNEVIEDHFAEYDADSFINDTLLSDNWDETVKALNEWNTSFHFYSYLAKNAIVPDDLCSLPFFNDETEAVIVDGFNDKFVFLSSYEGKKTCSASWLSSVTFSFVSPNYDSATLDYLKENAGVQEYSDDIIVNDIIQSEDYLDAINESQQEDKETSVAFVKFCFEHESSLGSGSLRNYALNSYDCDGDESFVLYEDHIFFPSECFDEYSQRDWLNYDWMYSLDSDYLKIDSDEDKVKTFLKKAFYIDDLDAAKFYKDIVRPNISAIVSNTSGSNDGDGAKNLDFISYLDANYNLVFEIEKDADKFESFVLIGDSDDDVFYDIASDAAYVYAHDIELKEILDSEWFPADTVNMCSNKYGESKSIIAIKASKYEFADFFNDVITEELDNINDTISTKESSVAFHSFIIDRLADLTDKQKEVMKGAKVYLYGQEEPAESSESHRILSAKARELFDLGLVDFSEMDIIDPAYKPEENTEYWEGRLANSKFNVGHFYSWLKDNSDDFSETLQDSDLNIKFWRWLKENISDKKLEIPALPTLLKNGEVEDLDEPVYFSDEYLDGAGIEDLVTGFVDNAQFISPSYVQEGDDIQDWKIFWIRMGVKYEIADILINSVIPNLSDIDNENLPKLFATNREALEKQIEDGLICNLQDLRVKAHDGKFYDISETIYVDCEKSEPFPYIEIPTQISFESAEERRLIKDIIDEIDGELISTLSEWQQRKVDCYLDIQNSDCEIIRGFHFQFIEDLSVIRNNERDTLKELERLEEIQLLNRDDDFCDASTLTMGSVYNPFFDFEHCSIESLDYVSDEYHEKCSEYVGRLFRTLKVHHDFLEEDIELLEDRSCSIYFWSSYLLKKDAAISRINQFVSDGKFDDIECIPTKDNMECPGNLYYGPSVDWYTNYIEDRENKIPLETLPIIELPDHSSLFSTLPFKDYLEPEDCLYVLACRNNGEDKTRQLLRWIIEGYNSSLDAKIEEYREDEHALWKNTKNDPVQIKELYALDSSNKILEQYFGANPRIINKDYFPSGDSYRESCDILQIATITWDDLKMEPVNDRIYTAQNDELKIYALVISGLTDAGHWKDLYVSYCESIDRMILHKCDSIMITYSEDVEINQSKKKFYHEPDANDFYFVDSLDNKHVFKAFVNEYVEFLKIDTDDIAEDVIEDIMDSRENALSVVMEQNALMLDDDFTEELDHLIPGIKRELNGNVADDDEEETPVTYRPTFTTSSPQPQDSENETNEDLTEIDDSEKTVNVIGSEDYEVDEDSLEAQFDDVEVRIIGEFSYATRENIIVDGESDQVICEHYRNGTWVRGHYRNGYWVRGHWRNGSIVSEHDRTMTPQGVDSQASGTTPWNVNNEGEFQNGSKHHSPKSDIGGTQGTQTGRGIVSNSTKPRLGTTIRPGEIAKHGQRPYTDHDGWEDFSRPYRPMQPKPFSPEDVRNFGSHGVTRTLEVLEPTASEVAEINRILGEDLSPDQVADQNYLAQLRLYNNLVNRGMTPNESKDDFVRNAHMKNEHTIVGGKYIHKCSAAGGIMYLSPAIWNKIADDRCVVCVYLGAKANEFMYFNSIDDILEWVGEDDIVIKLTGEEKADVVEELYSGVLDGVKGTAYTLIRINSNEKYNSLFAQLPTNNEINETEENEDEYGD